MTYFQKKIDSPVGYLTLIADDNHLVGLLWEDDEEERYFQPRVTVQKNSLLDRAEIQLREYFRGQRQTFDLPISFRGTRFQEKVWSALTKIPYGETRSYGQLAKTLGSPKACRAVGAANGRNPISIVVPCHRVIGASGDLTGFGGGLDRKKILLDLEAKHHST